MRNKTSGVVALVLTTAVTLGSCRLIVGTVAVGAAVVVGTVGLVGYTVYKGGEWVVKGVASVGSSTGKAVKDKHNQIVVSRGTLKAKIQHPIGVLYPAAEAVMKESGFLGVRGAWDSLIGRLTAKTSSGESVSVKLELLKENLTAIEILVGSGNLKQSEFLYDRILSTAAKETGQVEG
jgi:hypothetical protein